MGLLKFGYLDKACSEQIGEYKENRNTFEDVGRLVMAYYLPNPKIVLIGKLAQDNDGYLKLSYLYNYTGLNPIKGYRLLSEEFSKTLLKDIE